MGLLGKTLKGRSTKPRNQESKMRMKQRMISKNDKEFENNQRLYAIMRQVLKDKLATEQKLVSFNKRKLMTFWRKIMRIAKTEQLKNEIDIYMQNNQRELDSKEAFLQMLDKNLDEAQDQYQIALRNHMIHLDHLLEVQDSRLRGLKEEFDRDVFILEDEFDREREEMIKSHKKKVKELEDMIETVKDENRKKTEDAKYERQTFREETNTKADEELNTMKIMLDSRTTKYYNDLEQLHQRYSSETAKKTEDHAYYFEMNKKMSKDIDKLVRSIAGKKAKIDLMRLKILQHTKECQSRNLALKKEKENIAKNYQELKLKMMKFREEESRRLTELVNNSRNAVLKLKEYAALGEKILKTAELCRRIETEKEKVLPFYESTVEEEDIPEDLKNTFQEITKQEYHEYSYLNNFFKRFNKVLLDKLAIEKQKEALQKDNVMLKSLLKQYLDGISLNDDVLKNNNPLFVVNNKLNMSRPPVDKAENKTVIEGALVVKTLAKQLD